MGLTSNKTTYMLIGLGIVSALYCGYQFGAQMLRALGAFGLYFISATGLKAFYVYWTSLNLSDFITFIPIILLIYVLLKLSNREVIRTLGDSLSSERTLTDDRDALQARVEESDKELEESKLKRIQELSKAAEFGRLAQGLFHDLMTPLTALRLHTEKLKTGARGLKSREFKGLDQAHESLENAIRASERMEEYATNIRASLSQEDTDRPLLLLEEIEETISLFSYKTRSGDIKILVESSDPCPWIGNPLKIKQVFSNLISNAIDSFDGLPGKAAKEIKIYFQSDSREIIIKIKDNGAGIKKENLEKIFQPFFTTKNPDKGTGIGLATVKHIIEKDFGGRISVESRVNQGTEFTLHFPKSI